jgi:hypothetical protein
MGTGSFPGVNPPGRDVDHPPPSYAEVGGRLEIYLVSPWAFVGCSRANIMFMLRDRQTEREREDLLIKHKSCYWVLKYRSTFVVEMSKSSLLIFEERC